MSELIGQRMIELRSKGEGMSELEQRIFALEKENAELKQQLGYRHSDQIDNKILSNFTREEILHFVNHDLRMVNSFIMDRYISKDAIGVLRSAAQKCTAFADAIEEKFKGCGY